MDKPKPWSCSRCGTTESDWHNAWSVDVCGERPCADDEAVGEFDDDWTFEAEFCDRCVHRPDLVGWMLSRAVLKATTGLLDSHLVLPPPRFTGLEKCGQCGNQLAVVAGPRAGEMTQLCTECDAEHLGELQRLNDS